MSQQLEHPGGRAAEQRGERGDVGRSDATQAAGPHGVVRVWPRTRRRSPKHHPTLTGPRVMALAYTGVACHDTLRPGVVTKSNTVFGGRRMSTGAGTRS